MCLLLLAYLLFTIGSFWLLEIIYNSTSAWCFDGSFAGASDLIEQSIRVQSPGTHLSTSMEWRLVWSAEHFRLMTSALLSDFYKFKFKIEHSFLVDFVCSDDILAIWWQHNGRIRKRHVNESLLYFCIGYFSSILCCTARLRAGWWWVRVMVFHSWAWLLDVGFESVWNFH